MVKERHRRVIIPWLEGLLRTYRVVRPEPFTSVTGLSVGMEREMIFQATGSLSRMV